MKFALQEANHEMKKPRKPRSAYTIFAEEERAVILQEALRSGELSSQEVYCILNRVKEGRRRKRSGIIGYAEINRRIAASWKTLSDERKAYYDIAAQEDIKRCQLELQAWEKTQGKDKKNNMDFLSCFGHQADELNVLTSSSSLLIQPCDTKSVTLDFDLINNNVFFPSNQTKKEQEIATNGNINIPLKNGGCRKYSEKSSSQGMILLASQLDNESIDFICSLNSLSA
mmetsp:Transcript_4157/g.6305  ORF Transcript_4157/g.6305 Transcript_4157/m.6305 type:complete len:228 (-) Transcript_4157:39-722(-)